MADKMREEFEAWYINEGYSDRRPTRHLEGYAAPNVNDMWLSWKASRAALCVELPEVRVLDGGRIAEIGYELAIDDFERSLDAAGVRYK